MLNLGSRLPALFLTLVLSAGNVAVCAGWMATPEARMACCAEGAACPMHAESDRSNPRRVVTQAEADSCCAASEQSRSAQSESTFVLAISIGLAASPTPAVLPETAIHPENWRTLVAVPETHVLRHLLLSVLLV